MTKQCLNGANICPEPQVLGVVSLLYKLGAETVPECMCANFLVNFCEPGGGTNCFSLAPPVICLANQAGVQNGLVKMMTANYTGSRIE
jgi:hypothetical protein